MKDVLLSLVINCLLCRLIKSISLHIHILSYILLFIKNETSLINTFMFFSLGVAFIDFRTEKEWDEAMRKNKLFIGKLYPKTSLT